MRKSPIVERISLILICSNFLLPELKTIEVDNKTWIQQNDTSAHRLLFLVQHCHSSESPLLHLISYAENVLI
jgi:hypothetical protein